MEKKFGHRGFGYLAAVVSAILFSTKGLLIKAAYAQGAASMDFMALRYAFAMPFFAVIAWKYGGHVSDTIRFDRKDVLSLIVLVLLGYYLATWMDFEGLRFVSVGLERMVLYLHPGMVAIALGVLGRQRLGPRLATAISLSYLGLALCFSGETRWADTRDTLIGSAFIFGAAACYAVFLVGSERYARKLGVHRLTALGIALSGIIMMGQTLFHDPSRMFLQSRNVYGLALGLALAGTVIPVFLFGVALRKLGAAKTSVVGMSGPASALLMGSAFLGEPAGWRQWAGCGLTLAGGALLSAPAIWFRRVRN